MQAVIYYKKPFNFLNLGALAYLGGDSALTEVCAKLPACFQCAGLRNWWPARLPLLKGTQCSRLCRSLQRMHQPIPMPHACCFFLPQINLPFTNIKLSGQVRGVHLAGY